MSCGECCTKDERIMELEMRVRSLEMENYQYTNPPHPDLAPHVDWLNNRYFTRQNLHE